MKLLTNIIILLIGLIIGIPLSILIVDKVIPFKRAKEIYIKLLKTLAILLIILLIGIPISIPIMNDYCAHKVAKQLKNTPLPENTELLESVSMAGKLAGNGNGMDYLGIILIKSNLSIDELEEYYSKYRKDEWEYLVEVQKGQEPDMIDHTQGLKFSKKVGDKGYYVVYSWGDGPKSLFMKSLMESDLRGH